MKKHLIFMLCLAMLGSMLTACGTDTPENTPSSGTTTAATTVSTTADTAASDITGTTADTTASAAESTASTASASAQTTVSSAETTASAFGTAAAAASTAAETKNAAVVTAAEEQSGDKEAAKAAAEGAIKASNEQNKDAFLKYTNMDTMLSAVKASAEMMKAEAEKSGNNQSVDINIDEMMDKYMSQAYASFAFGSDYTINEGVYPKNFINYYNKELSDNMSDLEKELEAMTKTTPQLVEIYRKAMAPINMLYVFSVKHGDKTEDMYVRKEDGGWKVDMLAFSMIGYVQKSKISSANVSAKSLYNAVVTALVDMDAENEDIMKLDGIYTFKGSDFENLKEKGVTGMEKLKQKMFSYFNEITKIEELSIRIEKGSCVATAVKPAKGSVFDIQSDGEVQTYGAYPKTVTVASVKEIKSTKDLVTNMDITK